MPLHRTADDQAHTGRNGSAPTSPHPDEPDIWLTLTLGGLEFHFVACLTAALIFVCDLQRHRLAEHVRIAAYGAHETPRLPNECLFLEP